MPCSARRLSPQWSPSSYSRTLLATTHRDKRWCSTRGELSQRSRWNSIPGQPDPSPKEPTYQVMMKVSLACGVRDGDPESRQAVGNVQELPEVVQHPTAFKSLNHTQDEPEEHVAGRSGRSVWNPDPKNGALTEVATDEPADGQRIISSSKQLWSGCGRRTPGRAQQVDSCCSRSIPRDCAHEVYYTKGREKGDRGHIDLNYKVPAKTLQYRSCYGSPVVNLLGLAWHRMKNN